MQQNKKREFFVFSQFLNHRFIQKTKTLRFFSLFKVTTKKTKNLEENQKKQTLASDQTISEKFCFFVFFVFSFFFCFGFGSEVSDEAIVLFFFGFGFWVLLGQPFADQMHFERMFSRRYVLW